MPRNLTGVHLVDETVLAAMEAFADVAPGPQSAVHQGHADAPRPASRAAAGRGVRDRLPPDDPRGATSATPIPDEWATEFGIRRWGFHGASHRYIAGRMPELLGRSDIKVISCHLGGSSSLCAIRDGAVGRVQPGDEPADRACRTTTAWATSTSSPCRSSCGRPASRSTRSWPSWPTQSGLEGLSGAGATSAISRPPRRRATREASWPSTCSSPRSATTSVPISSSSAGPTRSSSPAGSARTRSRIRSGVCRDLDWFGIALDPALNEAGPVERSGLDGRLAGPGLDRADQRGDRGRPAVQGLLDSRCAARPEKSPDHEGFGSMFLARVTGSVVATQKVASMTGHKLLTVEPYRLDEKERDRLVPTGRTFVVVDTLGAGVGRDGPDLPGVERPPDPRDRETAHRRRGDRPGRHRRRRRSGDLLDAGECRVGPFRGWVQPTDARPGNTVGFTHPTDSERQSDSTTQRCPPCK